MIWALLISFGVAIVVWAVAWRGMGILVERQMTVDFIRDLAKRADRKSERTLLEDIANAIDRVEHRR